MIGKGSEIPNMTYDTYVIFSAKKVAIIRFLYRSETK